MCNNTRYISAEFAEGAVSNSQPHPVLQLTFDDVERATGIAIKSGMVVEHDFWLDIFRVRVRSSPTGDLLTGWVPIRRSRSARPGGRG